MYNFTSEVILNTLTLPEGNPRVVAGTKQGSKEINAFRVLRQADYKTEFLYGKVYKTAGTEGTLGKVVFSTIPNTAGLYRVSLGFKMNGKFLADYANAVYSFQKPVTVEFKTDAITGESANTNVEKMVNALKLALPEEYKFYKVESDATTVTVSCTDPYQLIDIATIEKHIPNQTFPSESTLTVESVGTITQGKEPFATGAWLIENLRYPTHQNVRYDAVGKDETPVNGAIYTQYSFRYRVPRQDVTGGSAVGQELVSVTNHVFYVKNDLVSEFESIIKNAKAFGADCLAV